MPTYDYVCLECKNEFEEFQRMSDPLIETCPTCEGKVQRKIGGGAGLHFKGSGFYITDYKSKSEKKNPVKEKTSVKKAPKGDTKK